MAENTLALLKEKAQFSISLLEFPESFDKEYQGYAISNDERGFVSEQEVDAYLEQVVGQYSFNF